MSDPQADLFALVPAPAPGAPGDTDAAQTALTLALYAERAYLDYAVSVVKGRALPDVADGQKPVQRRILYTMNAMGLGPDSRHVKSARVVGDVMGKFHPHGDQATYDAMVRMAQDFSLRYPLIDGQGNFGSRDDDPAAAMRYTEARLTPIARLLLDEIDQGTVDFAPNYDGKELEPRLLPARLPVLLLNGAAGIAVGMATEIPPHNLREVADAAQLLLREPAASLDAVLEHLRGPDFPGGAQIISSAAEIRIVYDTGRGALKVRARWRFEELARGQWQLVVFELPPGTSARRVQEEIDELTDPKLRPGKKSLSPEQQQSKQVLNAVLEHMRDESSREAAVRLVFEPRSAKVDRQEFVHTLLAYTSLEGNAPVNCVMIGRDGRPAQKPLLQVLGEWIEFRVATVRRRSQYGLERVRERIHVLEGRAAALLNIDAVIQVIRQADEPKPELMRAFALSARQAEDILELRLRQLARLEAIRIEQELAQRRQEGVALGALLDSEAALRHQVGQEIDADARRHADARRTLIAAGGPTLVEARVLDEAVTVIVSTQGYVRARSGHGHDAAQFSFKSGDVLYAAFECRTIDHLVALGSNGRVYSIAVAKLPAARGDGLPATALVELEAATRLVAYVAGAPQAPLLLATSGGTGFACQLGDLLSRQRGGKQFLALERGWEPLRPARVDAAGDDHIACVSDTGRLLVFAASQIKAQAGGGRGVMLLRLEAGERMVGAVTWGALGVVVLGTALRSGKQQQLALRPDQLAAYAGARAGKGRALTPRLRVSALVKAADAVPDALLGAAPATAPGA